MAKNPPIPSSPPDAEPANSWHLNSGRRWWNSHQVDARPPGRPVARELWNWTLAYVLRTRNPFTMSTIELGTSDDKSSKDAQETATEDDSGAVLSSLGEGWGLYQIRLLIFLWVVMEEPLPTLGQRLLSSCGFIFNYVSAWIHLFQDNFRNCGRHYDYIAWLIVRCAKTSMLASTRCYIFKTIRCWWSIMPSGGYRQCDIILIFQKKVPGNLRNFSLGHWIWFSFMSFWLGVQHYWIHRYC